MLQERKRAVVLRPKDPWARLALAEALHAEGQADAGAAELEKLLLLDPDDTPAAGECRRRARILLARTCLAGDRLTRAEQLLRSGANDGDVELAEGLAEVYTRMGRLDDALLYLDIAARYAPERADLRLQVAERALEAGLLPLAEEHAGVASRLSPGDPAVAGLLREIAVRRGDLAGAFGSPLDRGPEFLLGRALELARILGPDARAGALVTALRARDLQGAKRALVTAPPPGWLGPLFRGELAAAAGELALARRSYEGALERVAEPRARALVASRLAEVCAHAGDFAAARDAWRVAVAAGEGGAEAATAAKAGAAERAGVAGETAAALDGLGDALAALGDAAGAAEAWAGAARLDGSGPAAAKLAAARVREAGARAGADGRGAVGRIGALGWSGRGGCVSAVEAVAVPGRGDLFFTGNVGERGTEAARVAWSCVKARADALGIRDRVTTMDVHIHFSDTEIAKDGASAGIALALAAISAVRGEPLLDHLAATGEITVQGVVRPVAGLHEKLVAACLAGVTTVLLPRRNVLDVQQLPYEVRRRVNVRGVDSLPEAITLAFRR